MMGKRSLDGLMRHLVDQIALCGEHGKFDVDIPGSNIGVLASKRKVQYFG